LRAIAGAVVTHPKLLAAIFKINAAVLISGTRVDTIGVNADMLGGALAAVFAEVGYTAEAGVTDLVEWTREVGAGLPG